MATLQADSFPDETGTPTIFLVIGKFDVQTRNVLETAPGVSMRRDVCDKPSEPVVGVPSEIKLRLLS